MALKQLLKKNERVRDMVRQYRLRTGQPRWDKLLAASPDYWQKRDAAKQSGRNILIATSDGAYLAATRVESLLAIALTLRGASAHILLCDGLLPACIECNSDWYPDEAQFARRGPAKQHCKSCFSPAEEMFRSLGVAVHRYSDFLSAEDLESVEKTVAPFPFSEIGHFSVDGIAVGEHALAGALRFYARATLDDPHSETVLRRYLKAALLTARVTQRLIATVGFECAVFHHGIYVPHGIIGEVARHEKVRVVNWQVAYRKKSFIFSHHDTYHHTLMSEPTSNWENMDWTSATEKQIMDYLVSRWDGTNDWIHFNKRPEADLAAISRETGVDFSKSCIGMLTNVMWDAQLHYPANAFPNMLEWVLKTIEYFATRPDLQLLIRVHPAEITGTLRSRQPILAEIKKSFPILPKNVFIIPPESRLSTYAAMLQCNAVLIYGTKTGVELTAMGIPVIVAGEAWIRNKGLTVDVHSAEEYFQILDQLPFDHPLPPSVVQRARKYAYHFFFRRMIPLDLLAIGSGIPGFEVSVTDLRQLMPGSSEGLDTICNGILNEADFVYPAERLGHSI